MSKSTKAFIFNFISFAVFFLTFYYLVGRFTNLRGFFVPITSFAISTLLAPKFQALKAPDGDRLFMSWLFLKGVREIK